MANKMLIDATHPEETRVVVLRGSRIEDFDFESASKRQLRGNIYLAKVVRVEPSLQAAFVDYGGNRHGFLAFSEIHPDYYQIPVSDRQALLAEEEQEEPEKEERRPRRSRRHRGEGPGEPAVEDAQEPFDDVKASADRAQASAVHHEDASVSEAAEHEVGAVDQSDGASDEGSTHPISAHAHPADAETTAAASDSADAAPSSQGEPATHVAEAVGDLPSRATAAEVSHDADPHAEPVADTHAGAAEHAAPLAQATPTHSSETAPHAAEHTPSDADTGAEHAPAAREVLDDAEDEEEREEDQVDQIGGDALGEVPRRTFRPRRQYKIQEVIKRRQVLLVQVVKEERGNKGAAITTYLSLAGRYSVLMPNTARGGGISRKITDAGDRQRLKTIAQDLEVPDGMGVILRTAGAARTKPEVKRDFEYLMRAWETVRETTLASTAPTLVYEEGSLIKRAIRDLYDKDIEEIVVAGEEGYREAKAFMRLLQPSHLRNVLPWRETAPLFAKNGAEAQLDAMFSNQVTLKSGGTLVINQTEALVAIDVNSGRATREHNIEDTALRTNLEAADEVARQLRLRDLAGLIVVDFIDMEESRNNRAVERRMKDALKDDRARIQIGRISHFGLLEMSRQRMRTGVLEGSTEMCPHCAGAGSVRSTASIALYVLRALEEALLADRSRDMHVRTRGGVALYILNNKRAHLSDIEARFGVAVVFQSDESLVGTTYCAVERGEPASGIPQPLRILPPEEAEMEADMEALEALPEDEAELPTAAEAGEAKDGKSPARRRRRRGRGRDSSGIAGDAPQPSDDALASLDAQAKGGASARSARASSDSMAGEGTAGEATTSEAVPVEAESGTGESGEAEPGRRRRSRRGGRRGRDARDANGVGQAARDEEGAAAMDSAGGGAETAALHGDVPQDEGASTHTQEAQVEPSHADLNHADLSHADLNHAEPSAVDPHASSTLATSDGTAAADETKRHVGVHAASDAVQAPVPPTHTHPELVLDSTPAVSPVGDAAFPIDAAEPIIEADATSAAPRRPEPMSSEADPSRPKKSGWWQRAKATLGG